VISTEGQFNSLNLLQNIVLPHDLILNFFNENHSTTCYLPVRLVYRPQTLRNGK